MVKNTDDLYHLFSEEEINERKNQIKTRQAETSQAYFIKRAQEAADILSRENTGVARVIITEDPHEQIDIPIIEVEEPKPKKLLKKLHPPKSMEDRIVLEKRRAELEAKLKALEE